MTNRKAEDGPSALRLVSENADCDVDIHHAKQRAMRRLADLAAAILRTIAGSGSAAPVMQSALDYFDAQKELVALSGRLLTEEDERQALSLIEARLSSVDSDTRYREFEHAVGMERIVRGALRVAAHQVLKEREHFGGKYSTQAIEEGIATVVRATKGPQNPKRKRNKVVL